MGKFQDDSIQKEVGQAMKRPKLTLKAAKAIARDWLGTDKKLTPSEYNNADYRLYQMRLGNMSATITDLECYPGYACISFGGETTFFNLETMEPDAKITAAERMAQKLQDINDAVVCHGGAVFRALLEQYGFEECQQELYKAKAILGRGKQA